MSDTVPSMTSCRAEAPGKVRLLPVAAIRSRLAEGVRVRRTHLLPRRHVLRDLGLVREEPLRSQSLEPVMGLATWRLALLFFISGVAARFAIDKVAQAIRAGAVPAPLRAPGIRHGVICTPQAYAELRYQGRDRAGLLRFLPRVSGLRRFLDHRATWNHLWYVAYILVYTLIVAPACRCCDMRQTGLGGPLFAWLDAGPRVAGPFRARIPFVHLHGST